MKKPQRQKPTEHESAIFSDLMKDALERGIDVPKIIAKILRKDAVKAKA